MFSTPGPSTILNLQALRVGWREWVALPDLEIPAIKAKIDTGARTSALHTFRLESFSDQGHPKVRFWIHPLQRRTDIEIMCVSDVIDCRMVSDSGGHSEERYVIQTTVRLSGRTWPIEITLTNREDMNFRLLLGRTAMVVAGLVVDPSVSYLTGKATPRLYRCYHPGYKKQSP